jgi:hypothetical protein
MSLFGPNNFSNIGFNTLSVKEDSINLALHVLNMSKAEYNSLSKDDLLERKKQSLMLSSYIGSAFNILAYYKSNETIEDFDSLKLPHRLTTKKPEFMDFIEPNFNPNFEPKFNPDPFKFKDLAEPKFNSNTNYT